MDFAELLVSVTTALVTTDDIREPYHAAPTTLVLIRSQLRILEDELQQITEWQHYTDPQSNAQVIIGLQEAIDTVTSCIGRFQRDLESIQRASGASRPLGSASNYGLENSTGLFNESSLKTHLADVRECGTLMHFALLICQMPAGQTAQQESKNLATGASILRRVHESNGRQRQAIVKEETLQETQNRSANFDAFFTSVQEVEAGLGDSASNDSLVWQTSENGAHAKLNPTLQTPSHDNDELFLPRNVHVISSPLPPSSRPETGPSHQASPALPPKITQTRSNAQASIPQRKISRKPVQRMSVYAESVLSDATLEVSPIAEKGYDAFPPPTSYSQQPQQSRSTLEPPATSTLFNQASRSLSSLAEGFSTVGRGQNNDSPPPYVDSGSSPIPHDLKRRDTQGSLEFDIHQLNLIQVVRDNQVDHLLAMLDHGVNIDDVDNSTRRTAIIEATRLRRTKISQILIRSGSRLHLKDVDGNTALHFAASNGDSNICVLLLDAGAELNEYNREGETPLDLAARGGHTEIVTILLNTWVSQNGHATTLLKGFLEATKSGNPSTAQAFIDRGVQPSKMKESWKPVVYAAQSGSIPMIDLMLGHKCNIKAKDLEGWTALHYAAHAGQTAMVEKLLAWKVSWNTQTKKLGETALHLAILAGQPSTAMALILHKNANVSIKDNDNHQALHHAVRNGDVQLTTALLNRGAKVDAQTNYGWSPLHIAAAYGHLPLVAEFITRGVSIDEKMAEPSVKPHKKTNEAARKGYWCEIRWPHHGARAIHLALEFGHDDVVRILLASGAKINDNDFRAWKPLHYAAWNCRPQMVDLLVVRGASPHATTDFGNTPLSLGFREHGLVATMDEKQQVYDILTAAMYARKKSKLQKLTGMIGSSNTKDVGERNKAWHTAELAAALYMNGQLEDAESDSFSQLAPSTSSNNRQESQDQNDGQLTPQASASRLTKRMTD